MSSVCSCTLHFVSYPKDCVPMLQFYLLNFNKFVKHSLPSWAIICIQKDTRQNKRIASRTNKWKSNSIVFTISIMLMFYEQKWNDEMMLSVMKHIFKHAESKPLNILFFKPHIFIIEVSYTLFTVPHCLQILFTTSCMIHSHSSSFRRLPVFS